MFPSLPSPKDSCLLIDCITLANLSNWFTLICGDPLQLLHILATGIMSYLWTISQGIPGFIHWKWKAMFFPPLWIFKIKLSNNWIWKFAISNLIGGENFNPWTSAWRNGDQPSSVLSSHIGSKWHIREETSAFDWDSFVSTEAFTSSTKILRWGCLHSHLSNQSIANISPLQQISLLGTISSRIRL